MVERVFLYHYECSFVILCGSSNMYWGLLLTCHIVNTRVDVFWRGYGWFSERFNSVVGWSNVALRPNGSLWVPSIMVPARSKNTDLVILNTAFPASTLFDQHKNFMCLIILSLLA